MSLLKTISRKSYVLFGLKNKLVAPIVLPLTRLYSKKYDKWPDELKKQKKLAKKLAALDAQPKYVQARTAKWTELKQKYDNEVAAKPREIINVTLLDGRIVEGFSWEITPLDVAKSIGSALAAEVHLAKINDTLWDSQRPLETDCRCQFIKFDSQEGKSAYWKTAACKVAESLESLYCVDDGGVVCDVGSTENGFYADIHLERKTINQNDITSIEEGISKSFPLNRGKVDRIVASKSDASDLFAYNPFKLKAISEREGDTVPIYHCGSFIEISETPLIRHTKKLNAVKILKIESALLNGQPIQRIHGVAFPSPADLKDFLKRKT